MVQYSENEKQRLLSFPLDGVLAACGKRTDHRGYMYFSPFRDEDSPSFHIDARTNRWYDFGTAEGGGVVDLVCRLKGCGKGEVLDILAGFDTSFVHVDNAARNIQDVSPRNSSSVVRIDSVSDSITRYALVDYATIDRGVPMEIVEQYCKQVAYRIGENRDSLYYAIGFPNNSGGYVLRSARTKICSSSDVSTLDRNGKVCSEPSSRKALVFEGFFDMLAWRALYGSKSLDCDVCVLNSVSNWKRAADWLGSHSKVCLCLDNDDAGRRTVKEMAQGIKKVNGNLEVWDMSSSYSRYKDVGEMLEARQGRAPARSRNIH